MSINVLFLNLIKNSHIMDIGLHRPSEFGRWIAGENEYVSPIHTCIYVYYVELKVSAFIIAFRRLNMWTVVTIGHEWWAEVVKTKYKIERIGPWTFGGYYSCVCV